MSKASAGSRFILDFGSIKLPPDIEQQVDNEIRAAGLRGLAQLSLSGTRRLNGFYFDKFPGGIGGAWIPPIFPPTTGPTYPTYPEGGLPKWLLSLSADANDPKTLGPSDHTAVVRSVMSNAVAVARNVPQGVTEPSGEVALTAALGVDAIDEWTKSRIRAMLMVIPDIVKQQADLPTGFTKAVRAAIDEVSGLPAADQAARLNESADSERAERMDGFGTALRSAAAILEDGASTIYHPHNPFYALLLEAPPGTIAKEKDSDTLGETADADAVGAALGGGAGLLLGGVGAGPGAAAGGAGASVGYIVGSVISWLLE